MDYNTAKRIAESRDGQALIEFIKHKIKTLDRVSDIKHTTREEISLEVLARKKASEKMAEILAPLMDIEEDKDVEKPEIY